MRPDLVPFTLLLLYVACYSLLLKAQEEFEMLDDSNNDRGGRRSRRIKKKDAVSYVGCEDDEFSVGGPADANVDDANETRNGGTATKYGSAASGVGVGRGATTAPAKVASTAVVRCLFADDQRFYSRGCCRSQPLLCAHHSSSVHHLHITFLLIVFGLLPVTPLKTAAIAKIDDAVAEKAMDAAAIAAGHKLPPTVYTPIQLAPASDVNGARTPRSAVHGARFWAEVGAWVCATGSHGWLA
jgi:hypothetical protein